MLILATMRRNRAGGDPIEGGSEDSEKTEQDDVEMKENIEGESADRVWELFPISLLV